MDPDEVITLVFIGRFPRIKLAFNYNCSSLSANSLYYSLLVYL